MSPEELFEDPEFVAFLRGLYGVLGAWFKEFGGGPLDDATLRNAHVTIVTWCLEEIECGRIRPELLLQYAPSLARAAGVEADYPADVKMFSVVRSVSDPTRVQLVF